MTSRRFIWGILVAFCLCGPAAADLEIDTIDPDNALSINDDVVALHHGGVNTWGQTFVAVSGDERLTSMSFFLKRHTTNTNLFSFRAYVRAWDETNEVATGGNLYESATMTSSSNTTGFDTYTFSPNINLTAGDDYIAFISSAGIVQNSVREGFVGYESGGNGGTQWYSAGQAWRVNAGTGNDNTFVPAWNDTGTPWSNQNGRDLAFVANFTPTPEPGTWLLTGLGALMGIAVWWRRRRGLAKASPSAASLPG